MSKSKKQVNADFDIVVPDAPALIESLRALGYNPQTAIADLLDNSLSAEAQNIWLLFYWDGPNSFISVLDDGLGMTEDALLEAMRPGSKSPLEIRHPRDLGRFGLGLKTASFSQCRRLTVCSKVRGRVAVRCWDLDHVQQTREWRLLRTVPPETKARLAPLAKKKQGTIVLWEKMDRLVRDTDPDNKEDHRRFLDLSEDVERHLGMVFHRFLEGRNPVSMFINGTDDKHRVKPWDPFLEQFDATQKLPNESIQTASGIIEIRAFVLPHHDRLERKQHEAAAGPAGWNAQQGFYVYRNRRMLVPGDWLGLNYTKEEHYKLARILIDIPNTADGDWQIDVKKSTARPPASLRRRLRQIAEDTRSRAVAVYRHRGEYRPRQEQAEEDLAWLGCVKHGRVCYSINRDHPLVRAALDRTCDDRAPLAALLRLLEETVPVQKIWLDQSEKPDSIRQPFETTTSKEVVEVIRQVHAALVATGLDDQTAWERVRAMAAFEAHQAQIAALMGPSLRKK